MSTTATTARVHGDDEVLGLISQETAGRAPDPWRLAGIMIAVFGSAEVSARAVAAAHRAPLGRTVAELEHARALGLVERPHPGHFRYADTAGTLPVAQCADADEARWHAGLFLLASSRKAAASIPGSLLPEARIRTLPRPDPTIVDAHSAADWAQVHRHVVLRVAADAARALHADRQVGLLAVELALAATAVAMLADPVEDHERLALSALDTAAAIGDDHGRACALELLGRTSAAQGRYELAQRRLQEALALWEQRGDLRGIICSTNALGLVDWASGDLIGARHEFRRAIKLANTRSGRVYRHLAALARQHLAGAILAEPDLPQRYRTFALELLDQAEARHRTLGALQGMARCSALRAQALRTSGDPDDLPAALAAAHQGVSMLNTSGHVGLAGQEYAELARCLRIAGDQVEAVAWAETAIVLFRSAGDRQSAQGLAREFTADSQARHGKRKLAAGC